MPFRPAMTYGNAAVAQQPEYEEETEYERNFAASIAEYREQQKKNTL
jgi:hypothetical protein